MDTLATADVESLTRFITDEILNALSLGKNGWVRNTLGPIFHLPARRFSEIAAKFDQDVEMHGFCEAAKRILPCFISGFKVRGIENIPMEGPLIVVSNHPGAYDSLVISANVPRRDLKVVATGVEFLRALPHLVEHLIYVSREPYGRMGALRAAIRHLEQGGALLIFPTGIIDPDPSNQCGGEQALEQWSPSLNIMLRSVPQVNTLVTIASGVIEGKWLKNPIVRLQKKGLEQRRLAEFFQVMQQLVLGQHPNLIPYVSFAHPLTTNDLGKLGDEWDYLSSLISYAKRLLAAHREWIFSIAE